MHKLVQPNRNVLGKRFATGCEILCGFSRRDQAVFMPPSIVLSHDIVATKYNKNKKIKNIFIFIFFITIVITIFNSLIHRCNHRYCRHYYSPL